ncbi:MAG TPA: carboxypeptidase-like regulatory domain-containing protein [Acidobacteriaceae bacterium]|nr:carboxypeptidase-like regulatory domain-containing protein [Acidobacteriaceae bacterium]
MRFRNFALSASLVAAALSGPAANAAPQEHGRKYKALPPTANVTVTVVKAFNGKPFPNAGVVFHANRDGKSAGNLEVKTDPDGHAKIDVLEVGSHVLLQVIAKGFATYAAEFDLTEAGKEVSVALERPRAQVSTYENNDGKSAAAKPGVQERKIPAPANPEHPR